MRISIAWLGDFVNLGDRSPEQIAADLTLRTALIEGIERKGALPEAVVVGRVIERRKHLDADRLSVCQVDIGTEVLEIVCGAPNVAAGQMVAVATVGADLPNGVKIKRSKIRGVASNGMICAEDELGLGEGHDGILVLEDGLELGRPFREIPGVADAILEIDNKSITHRPDLWGHEGFARELAAIYAAEFTPVPDAVDLRAGAGPIRVEIDATDLCGRYQALFARGTFGGASPAWMARRLTYCGLRPLSLAVDLSNYVMLDIGQPTHPFDRREIRGGLIRVRRANPGERLVTLEGTERTLPADACVIADTERALAVAGILGGAGSGIRPDTTDLVLESAWFEPIAVRRTSVAIGIRTDALARFEKHLDPALSERAIRRYARLLREIVPATVIDTTFERAGDLVQPEVRVRVRPDRVRARLGIDLGTDLMRAILTRIGFRVGLDGEALVVDVPSFRATRDVRTEEDLIEEIGRLNGYESIPPALPRLDVRPTRLEPANEARRRASESLRERHGFAEVQSSAFQDDQVLARAGGDAGPWLEVRNPQQQSGRRLRRSLVPWLLEFVDRNVKSVESVRLFECGRVFLPAPAPGCLPEEPLCLAGALADRVTRKERVGRVLRELKGCLEDLAVTVGRQIAFVPAEGQAPPFAHPGRVARAVSGAGSIGWIAQVHPRLADQWNWRGEAAVFEVDLAKWLAGPKAERRYRAPARFPATWIDVSFVVPFALSFAEIEAGIRASADAIESVDLVDEYSGSNVAGSGRSLTIRVSFRADDRTLDEVEVSARVEAVKNWLVRHGAAMRGEAGAASPC